jgi:hypothetical protein
MENREERLTYGLNPVTILQYWATYKWWLRREYRYQQRKAANEGSTGNH